MTEPSAWRSYQEWLCFIPGLEIAIDFSRMRLDSGQAERLGPSFEKAFHAMKNLEAGAIANPDEKRRVGHYWMRNPDLAPEPELRIDERDIDRLEAFVKRIHDGTLRSTESLRFTDVLVIGIGGSALGPQLLADALSGEAPPLNIHFIDNTDPTGIDRVLRRVQPRMKSTLVLVISKSGGTPEPRNGMLEAERAFTLQGLNFDGHAIAVTMEGSALHRLAVSRHWMAAFPMYDWVGGRFSATSAVGLLPAALQGIDIRAFLSGARPGRGHPGRTQKESGCARASWFGWKGAGGRWWFFHKDIFFSHTCS
jgi:glucose-6-phosphate isomerase